MNLAHLACVLAGMVAGMAVQPVMGWIASLRHPRAEPTYIGDSTTGQGL